MGTKVETKDEVGIDRAKVFMTGRSQAVRIPKKYRFDVDEVCIRKVGHTIMLYPADKAWDVMFGSLDHFTEDFMADRNQPPAAEEREPL